MYVFFNFLDSSKIFLHTNTHNQNKLNKNIHTAFMIKIGEQFPTDPKTGAREKHQ